jgi:hypothetical protein
MESRHGSNSECKFQTPTPWHNSIIKIEGEDTTYLAKSQIARDAISSGLFEGGWVIEPEGGHFALRHAAAKEDEEPRD